MFYETPFYYVWKSCVKLGYACFVQKLWAYKIGGTCWLLYTFICCECENEKEIEKSNTSKFMRFLYSGPRYILQGTYS